MRSLRIAFGTAADPMEGTKFVRADGHPVFLVPSTGYFSKLHYRLRERLPIWTVYRPGTREYPDSWVARMHVALPEPKVTRFVITHDTLDELRSILPPGLTKLNRSPQDAPEIVETWL